MNLTQKQRKLITSLRQKKYRVHHKIFVVEGIKVIEEFLNSSYTLVDLFSTFSEVFSEYNPIIISENELKKISNLSSPNKVLALFKIPEVSEPNLKGLTVALDAINDPGNLGTIIRLCDWFGIENILCSKETVDCFNPKVVQSSMGSLTRVQVTYVDLFDMLTETELPVFIADMEGENIYKTETPKNAVLVMGNEANGVSNKIKQLKKQSVSIPRFGKLKQTESLNVATATAILLSEFRR